MTRSTLKKLLIIPALALGVAAFIMLKQSRQGPEQLQLEETARPVRVIIAQSVDLIPRALGYGEVQPGQVWEAVAEVSGRVIETHPDLDKGAILPRGAVLLRIDPTDYTLARTRAESQVQTALARLRELDQKEEDTLASLKVEKKALQLAEAELERKRELLRKGLIAKSEVDREEKNYLAQKNAVQNYQATLNAIPSEREDLQAQLRSGRSSLEDSMRDLDRTVVTAPFDCRISQVNVELDQFATTGQVLVRADSMTSSEVLAHFPMESFRAVMPPELPDVPLQNINMDQLRKHLDLNAVVRLRTADQTIEWEASFSRPAEELDPATRSIGVYVAVDSPYLKVRPSSRPPLVKNMYCEVELRGPGRPGRIVLPRSALRQGRVYIAGPDNRLEIRPVRIDYRQGSLAAVTEGIHPGERIVVSDLMPAVESMLLETTEDQELQQALVAEATAQAPAR